MVESAHSALREGLEQRKQELLDKLERITANVRRGYEADSKERAKQLEDNEVVDALGNEARAELVKIGETLRRIDADEYGICVECGSEIGAGRLAAYPYADECIDCAHFEEHRRQHRP